MSETLSLPVLPLDDSVVLPTMVVPVEISDAEVRAAIEAARMSAPVPSRATPSPQLLLVPRIGGKYSSVGTLGVVEQTGRLPSGEPAAVIRGLSRVRIGTGTVGPGAALWVEGTVVDEPPATARAQELAREYRGHRHVDPAEARRVAGHRRAAEHHRPVRAGRQRRLRRLPHASSSRPSCWRRSTPSSAWSC